MRGIVMVSALMLATACSTETAFRCESDEQCTGLGAGALCQRSGYCSFFDDECPADHRYGELAPDNLAGQCVVVEEDTGASTGAGSDDDDGTIAPTAGSPADPYGRCTDDCELDGSTCLETMSDPKYRMCAPACDQPAETSSDQCPAPLGAEGYAVACRDLGDEGGNVACFINCDEGRCPNGMECTAGSVCSWQE